MHLTLALVVGRLIVHLLATPRHLSPTEILTVKDTNGLRSDASLVMRLAMQATLERS